MAGILKLLLAYCLPKFQTKHQVTFLLWLWHQLWHRRRHNLRFPRQTRTLRKWCVLWRRISTICLVCFPPLWFLFNDYAYFRARSIQAEFPEISVWSQMEHLLLSVRLKFHKYLGLPTKMAKTIGMIYKPKHSLPKKSLTCLSFMSLLTLLQPSAGLQLIKPIYIALILLWRRTVQIIDNKDYRARSEPYFKNLKILRRNH